MSARIPTVPKGRPFVDLSPADARRLIAGRRKVERARAEYISLVAQLVGRYGAGGVGRVLGISRQSVHALLARRGGQSDIKPHGQATKDEPGE